MTTDYSRTEDDHHQHRSKLATLGDLATLAYPLMPTAAMCAVAKAYGRLRARLEPHRFRTLVDNLSRVPGVTPEEARRLARRYVEDREVRTLLLTLSAQMELSDMEQLFRVEGVEHLDEALRRGKGAFLLLSHVHSLGGFLAVAMLRKMGYDVQVALPSMEDPWSDSRLRALMSRITGRRPKVHEMVCGFYCQFNLRPIAERLRKNVIVAQTGDGWHSAAFVDCDFFGQRLPFTTGVISAARSLGAAIVPMFVTGDAPRLSFVCEPPMTVQGGKEEVALAVRAYVARLEHHLKGNLHAWEHWTVPSTFDSMLALRQKTLREKYIIGHD